MIECKLRVKIRQCMIGYEIDVILQHDKHKLFGFERTGKLRIVRNTGSAKDIVRVIESYGGVNEYMLKRFKEVLENAKLEYGSDGELEGYNKAELVIPLEKDQLNALKRYTSRHK